MESVEILNERLRSIYGLDSNTAKSIFRIVWSEDQLEKRLVDTLDSGILLLHPEVREVKKYPYIRRRYILERLVVVPEVNLSELPTQKLSYEPIWTYEANGNALPPTWPATKVIVDILYAALGKKSLRKYIESEKNTTEEGRIERVKKIQEELFGNETETGDALRYKEGIVVPSSYSGQKKE